MTLGEKLRERLQVVGDLAGSLATQEAFQREMLEVTLDLKAALELVKQLALAQAAYLWGQTGRDPRMN